MEASYRVARTAGIEKAKKRNPIARICNFSKVIARIYFVDSAKASGAIRAHKLEQIK
jgi:hypothetical protein